MAVICDFYQAVADEKNIQIIRNGNATVNADPVMFRRMLNNILSNALKYTLENGIIRIDAHDLQHSVQLKISDNGIGISAEHLPHIFDRFYRADHARSSCGIGLGLSIVKSIVDLHHGTISVVSEALKGTTFIIQFPTN